MTRRSSSLDFEPAVEPICGESIGKSRMAGCCSSMPKVLEVMAMVTHADVAENSGKRCGCRCAGTLVKRCRRSDRREIA